MLRRKKLIRLCIHWQTKVRGIPYEQGGWDMWGPSEADLSGEGTWEMEQEGNICATNAQASQGSESEDDCEDEESCGVDDDLFEEAEAVALTDMYHANLDNSDIEYI
jgi:hypothetical protein